MSRRQISRRPVSSYRLQRVPSRHSGLTRLPKEPREMGRNGRAGAGCENAAAARTHHGGKGHVP